MPKAMIITVGTGETVSHGICSSINQQNPTHIVFILTKESKEKTLPLILNDNVMKEKSYEEKVLNNPVDVEAVKEEIQNVVTELMKKKFEPKDIAVDYTSGTKSMSVGVVLSAIENKLGTLVYVSGMERDKNGRVISGTERVLSFEPNKIYAESLLKEAISLFNSYQFESCQAIVKQARELLLKKDFQERVNLLEKLAQAYSSWDKFDLNKAFSILVEISRNSLLAGWGIRTKIEKHKELLHKEKSNYFCLERVADLLENARRRGDIEGKYDDAVGRLYRCLEYIAQIHIEEKGLYKKDARGNSDTENLDITKIPKNLQDKYLKYKDLKDNKVKLGLFQSYELLFDLGEKIGILFKQSYERGSLKKLLSLRNNSIFAHGFNPVSEELYREMFSEIKNFVKEINPKIEYLMKELKFPKILY